MSVSGQTADNPWTTPKNLSVSGSASQPQIVSDSQGLIHIIWQDSIDDYIYVQGDGITWSEPQSVELPFGTRRFYPDLDEDEPTPLFRPHLAVEEEGFLHAIWIDDIGDLYYSGVAFENFTEYSSWSARQKIAASVLTASLDIGPDGRLHIIYLQTAEDDELQPGIFYTQSDDGETWLESISLFTSLYYRLMEAETANVQLAVANENSLFVAWDDWPNERVLLTRSLDGGVTWDNPDEIDKRQENDDITAVGPSAIQLAANDEIIHVIWQAGHNDLACSPYYQWSADNGDNWQPAQRIWDKPTDCPTEIHLEEYGDSYLIKATTSVGSLIVPWNSSKWGIPQPQTTLDTMKDPETFKPVTYTCGQDTVGLEERLWLVACGAGTSSQDIWLLSRSLTGLDVVQATSIWGTTSVLAKTERPINAPIIVADEENRLHAFWGRINLNSSPFQQYQTVDLQYARWDAEQWSTPKTILYPVRMGDGEFSVTASQSGRLLVVWSEVSQSEIYFSQVAAGLAVLSSEWSEPQLLSKPGSMSSSPEVVVDHDGVIYVIYIVPVNEERGIYLVKSTDNGNTWTEPDLVLDLNDAQWNLIDKPSLALTGDGQLHLFWLNQPFIGTTGASLHYVNSLDGGENWSEPTAVLQDNEQDTVILWNQIVGAENGTVHRLWQGWVLGQISLWHQISGDNGQNWSQPLRVVGLNASTLPTALTLDRTGQLHLIYFDQSGREIGEDQLLLYHLVWRNDQWHRDEALALDEQSALSIDFVAAEVGTNDELAALYSGPLQVAESTLHSLFFNQRVLDLPDTAVAPQPIPTFASTPTVEPSPTITLNPSPTPAPTLAPSEANVRPIAEQPSLVDNIIIGLAAAAIPVALLFTVFIMRQNRKKR